MLDKCVRDQWSIDDLDWSIAPPELPRDKEEAVVQYFTDMAGHRAARRRAVRGPARARPPTRRSRRSSRRSSSTRSATPRSPRASRSTTTSTTIATYVESAVARPRSGRTSSRVVAERVARDRERVHHVGRADPRRRAAALARRLRRRRDEPPRDAPDQPRRVAPHRDRLPHDRGLRVRRAPRRDAPRGRGRRRASSRADAARARDDDVAREAVPAGGVPRADGSHRSERPPRRRRRSSAIQLAACASRPSRGTPFSRFMIAMQNALQPSGARQAVRPRAAARARRRGSRAREFLFTQAELARTQQMTFDELAEDALAAKYS